MKKSGLLMAAVACQFSVAAMGGMTAIERRMGRFMRGPDAHPQGKSAADLAVEVKASFDAKHDKVKEVAEQALAEAKSSQGVSEQAKNKADELLVELNETKTRLTDLEQKASRGPGDGRELSAGQQFAQAEGIKSFLDGGRGASVAIEVKDLSSLTTNAAGSVGALANSDRIGVHLPPQRRLTIRDLIAPGQTDAGSIEYEREVAFTNNAAPTAEGAASPQSELQYEDVIGHVRTVSHFMRANRQTMEDAAGLASMVDVRLRHGLALKEEVQLLTGSGSGSNLTGMIPLATAFAPPPGFAPGQSLDIIRLQILQVALSDYPASGIVLNPVEMALIELLKDTAQGYLIGNPANGGWKSLWGLPTVETPAIDVDKSLVGAFDLAVQVFDRQQTTVEASYDDQDNFTKGKVTILARSRLVQAIYAPAALSYADFGRVA